MSRRIYLFLFFLFPFLYLNAQDISFSLKGNTSDISYENKTVYLQKLHEDRKNLIVLDSTVVDKNRFSFQKTIENGSPSMLFVSIIDTQPEKQILFIPENGEITVSFGEQNIIGGTPQNESLQKFMSFSDSLGLEIRKIDERYSKLNQTSDIQEKKVEEIEPLFNLMKERMFNFAKSNIKNDVGEYITLTAYQVLSPDQVLSLVEETRPEFKNSDLGQEVITFYEAWNMRNGNGSYKDVKLKSREGKETSLSDYVGENKVVLIDFWASWCGPCIKEMPKIVKAYETYKNKGFEIVGISLDDNEQSWKKAVERMSMTWAQMSDLKGWKSEAVRLYGVQSIPYALLVDQDGKILSSYSNVDDLMDKLKELLD